MNRPIKFRAWDRRFKRFVNWHSCIPFDSEEYVIQQFTGLVDYDGKEIWEGDLLTDIEGHFYKIDWWNEEGGWSLNLFKISEKFQSDFWDYQSVLTEDEIRLDEYRVIGHIFEHYVCAKSTIPLA